MNNFYKDLAQFTKDNSQGIIDAYNRGLVTFEETLTTMLDNKRNADIEKAKNEFALDRIYNNLQTGKEYGYNIENVRFPYFHTCIECDPDFIFIRWNHYGSSANKNTKEELFWIITTIFGMSPIQFEKAYILK